MRKKQPRFPKIIFLLAALITLFLLFSLFIINTFFDDAREEYINEEMQQMFNSLNEMQIFLLMSETFGDEMACLASAAKLEELDKSVWKLGVKIDQYRVASEEFQKDPYYLKQKQLFNENEVFYLMLLTKLQRECNLSQGIISFFYQNSEDCKKCDDQSFILSDINREYDEEISIFSFDADLNLTTLKLLENVYNVTNYPCVIINEQPYCGIQGKEFIIDTVCETQNLSFCEGS